MVQIHRNIVIVSVTCMAPTCTVFAVYKGRSYNSLLSWKAIVIRRSRMTKSVISVFAVYKGSSYNPLLSRKPIVIR